MPAPEKKCATCEYYLYDGPTGHTCSADRPQWRGMPEPKHNHTLPELRGCKDWKQKTPAP